MPQKKKAPSWRPSAKRTSFQDAKKGRPATGGPRAARPVGTNPRREETAGEPRRSERSSEPWRQERSGEPRRSERSSEPWRQERSNEPRRQERTSEPRRQERSGEARRTDRSTDFRRPDRNTGAPRRGGEFRGSSNRPPKTQVQDVIYDPLVAISVTAESADGLEFGDLGLGPRIVDAIKALGAPTPFALQAATIPVALSGRDVLGRGRTGSGKTIAFSAPVVERLLQMSKNGVKRAVGRAPRALILAPTRELALQIDRTVQPIARSVGLFTTQIYGGVPIGRQMGALERGVDIVIGTPGRIEDLMARGKLDVSQIAISVIDEADHMSELGFIEPLQRILRSTAPQGQRLLYSATLDQGVTNIVREFLKDPAVFEVAGENQESSTIDHQVWVVDQRDKRDMVVELARKGGKTLMFARTRAFAEELADMVDDAGIPAVSLHGDLNQARRQRNLDKLSSGRVSVLVATDVAARGIHVDDIDTVVQVDAPDDHKSYVHRSGRTGRAGKQGTVITLTTRARTRRLIDILKSAGISANPQDMRPSDVKAPSLV